MGFLNPSLAAYVEDPCRFFVIILDDLQVIKCSKVPPHHLEFRRIWNTGKYLLANRSDKNRAKFFNQLGQFVDQNLFFRLRTLSTERK